MRLFLKATAGELLILNIGACVLTHFLFASYLSPEPVPQEVPGQVMLSVCVLLACFLGWFWAVGKGLNTKVPEGLRLKSGLFTFGLAYAYIYGIAVFVIDTAIHPLAAGGPVPLAIFPFHLCAMAFTFYAVWFVAKTLKMAETGQRVRFDDYSREFWLLVFFPIGLWVIQPRVNKICSYGNRDDGS